ncbi:MAG: cadherin-like beta sandwich domain-containing protein [Clostridiales bacterium]|jgi:disulfide oxidoreductase YuzD|nr:cadherin-like beta sandwich domain-containing protein [Clostridiales bacterium]
MKKILCLLLIAVLALGLMPAAFAQQTLPPERLVNLVHNAPNTGKMLPERFNPYQDTYLLTVASWVSRITFTPTTASPNAVVTVNGQVVASGQKSQIIQMSNDPQAVSITVSVYSEGNVLSAQNTYTVYLQRRPSERRTRVSAGFISTIDVVDGIATINADLVTINYQGNTNLSSYTNETVYMYKYKTSPNCLFYYGTASNPVRAADAQTFLNNYLNNGSSLYNLIYIEDEIVAVMPYGSN